MLCLFAQHFPKSVASLLQRGEKLRRRFREETITDLLMANLLALGGDSIFVDFPDEPSTGADMEWNFINKDTREHFQILLQAKKLSDTGADWRMHRYKELFYRSGSKKLLQVETLCTTAISRSKATYPAYIFYNLARTCNLAHVAGAKGLLGVNLTDAAVVRALAASSPTKWYERKHSAISALYPFMFSLTDLFCPSNIQPLGIMAFARSRFSIPTMLSFTDKGPILGRPLPPRPDQIRSRLVEHRNKLKAFLKESGVVIDLPEIPEVSREIPENLQSLLGDTVYTKGISSPPIDYWRATFISTNPTDEFGHPVSDDKQSQ